jgi:hypothetical protein
MPLGRSCFKWVAVLGDDLLMFDQLLMLFRVTINVVLHVYQLIDGSSSKPMHTIYVPTTYCTSNLLIFKFRIQNIKQRSMKCIPNRLMKEKILRNNFSTNY